MLFNRNVIFKEQAFWSPCKILNVCSISLMTQFVENQEIIETGISFDITVTV